MKFVQEVVNGEINPQWHRTWDSIDYVHLSDFSSFIQQSQTLKKAPNIFNQWEHATRTITLKIQRRNRLWEETNWSKGYVEDANNERHARKGIEEIMQWGPDVSKGRKGEERKFIKSIDCPLFYLTWHAHTRFHPIK